MINVWIALASYIFTALFFRYILQRVDQLQKERDQACELLMDARHVLGAIDAPGNKCPLCGSVGSCGNFCRVPAVLKKIDRFAPEFKLVKADTIK